VKKFIRDHRVRIPRSILDRLNLTKVTNFSPIDDGDKTLSYVLLMQGPTDWDWYDVMGIATEIIKEIDNLKPKRFEFTSSESKKSHVIVHDLDSEFINVSVLTFDTETDDWVYSNDKVMVSTIDNNAIKLDSAESHYIKIAVSTV
jgi:hypothetical protein